jgi:hypothetical protein
MHPGQKKAKWKPILLLTTKKLILNFLKHTVMRKQFFISIFIVSLVQAMDAQTRGTKLGFIDMEYILQNVPDYTEAKAQLEQN